MIIAEEPKTYTSKEVAKLIEVPYSTLMNWVQAGLLSPNGANSGHGFRTAWSEKDLVEAKRLAELRSCGVTVTKAKEFTEYLRGIGHNPLSRGEFQVVKGSKDKAKDVVKTMDGNSWSLYPDHLGQLVMNFSEED